MPDEFTESSRAERAFEDHFAERARSAEFPPLVAAELIGSRRRRRHPGRWAAGLAVAAVVVLGVILIVPLGIGGPGRQSAVPAATGGPGQWRQTSPIPIGQRYRSIDLWTGGAFYIIGGISHCGLDAQGNPVDEICAASLPSPGESLADGARYDPATDTWTRIADAPVPIGGGQGVVVGDAIYVVAESGDREPSAVLRYDPSADTWTRLPTSSEGGEKSALQLLTWGGDLYAATVLTGCDDYDCRFIERWDTASGTWHQEVGETGALRFAERSLTSIDDGFVALYRDGHGSSLAAAAYRDGSWHELPDAPFDSPPDWLGAIGNTVVAVSFPGAAYALDVDAGTWRRLPEPASPGGLTGGDAVVSSPHFADGTRVVVAGQLYDPARNEWTDVPSLPNPRWGFGAFAGNGTQVLACFVGPTGSMNDCHLLELGTPTPATQARVVNEWVATAQTPLAARTDALAAWTGNEFLVVGGTSPDGAAYDPETGRWRTIATPPVAVDASARWTVFGHTLYVIPASGQGFWAYDLDADAWRQLPDPPDGAPSQLLVTGEVLLALGEGSAPDAWFDPGDGVWTDVPSGTYPRTDAGGPRVAAFTGKELLIGTSIGGRTTFQVFDIDSDGRRATTPSTAAPGPWAGEGTLVVNDVATTVLVPAESSGAAGYRVGGVEKWVTIPGPGQEDGPLASGLLAGSQVSLHGHLYNTETRAWRLVPALPDGAVTAAVQAAGPDAVLSCFGRASGTSDNGCHLLPQ